MEWRFAVISTTKLNYSILLMGEKRVNGVNERLIVGKGNGQRGYKQIKSPTTILLVEGLKI